MITLHKEVKKGLPGFSNVTASVSITVDEKDFKSEGLSQQWEVINAEIENQINILPLYMEVKKQVSVPDLEKSEVVPF